jgi:hypothetical protein
MCVNKGIKYMYKLLHLGRALIIKIKGSWFKNIKGMDVRVSPQLIIHIGDGKCGSTAIQGSLFDAKDILSSEKILYYPPDRAGHFSYITFFDGRTRGDNDKAFIIARDNFSELIELVKSNPPEFILFSSESFFSIPPDKLIRLLAPLTPGKVKVHIIAYIRCPAEQYLSQVQQIIKASHRIIGPNKYFRNIAINLVRWLDHPQTESITVRHFKKEKLIGGSVVMDFEDVLKKITSKKITLPDVVSNASLSAEQMIVLQRYRQRFLAAEDGIFHPDSNRLIHFFESMNLVDGLVKTKPRLAPCLPLQITSRHANVIKQIQERFPSTNFQRDCYIDGDADGLTFPWVNEDISQIFAEFDCNVVAALEFSIPRFASRVDDKWYEEAIIHLKAIGISEEGLVLYRKFLTKVK